MDFSGFPIPLLCTYMYMYVGSTYDVHTVCSHLHIITIAHINSIVHISASSSLGAGCTAQGLASSRCHCQNGCSLEELVDKRHLHLCDDRPLLLSGVPRTHRSHSAGEPRIFGLGCVCMTRHQSWLCRCVAGGRANRSCPIGTPKRECEWHVHVPH